MIDLPPQPSMRRFAQYSWVLLVYCVLVVLWGAFVRATGAGAGCGSHWPLCNGEFIPQAQHVNTFIEFGHRVSSGLIGIFVLLQLGWAWSLKPAQRHIRLAAVGTLVFTITEGLIGRALVKYGWVAQDTSPARAIVMSAHLVNTLILVALMTMVAGWASGVKAPKLRGQGPVGWLLGVGAAGLLLLGVSGALNALGDTLFPAKSSYDVIQRTLTPGAHLFERLRLVHPLLAMTVGLYAILMGSLVAHLRKSSGTAKWNAWVGGLILAQVGAGGLNVILKAPVAMQLVHLLLANMVWISVVMLGVEATAEGVVATEAVLDAAMPVTEAPEKATWKHYIALTKPRVISLLLFTCLAAMFIAAGGWPGMWLLIAVGFGGYMAAGSANAINMVIERDLDGRMKRTSKRPTVTTAISANRALMFAAALEIGSFTILWAAANLLTAALALAGLVFYVVVYTLILKRRTWHNIVIGGAAGSIPPLVGCAAVNGNLDILAWYLFAIIFLWTPVHFWALAIMIKDDYAEAGVPMLPVVMGDRATAIQIAIYAVLTAAISAVPFLQHQAGWIYLVGVIALNLLLLERSAKLLKKLDRPRASSLFHYSMLYLFLLFLMMAVDRAVIKPVVKPEGAVPVAIEAVSDRFASTKF